MYRCAGLLPGALQQRMGLSCALLLSDILEGVQGELNNLHNFPELLCWNLQTLGVQLAHATHGVPSAPTPGFDKFLQQLLSKGWARIVQASSVMNCVFSFRHACAQLPVIKGCYAASPVMLLILLHSTHSCV